MVRFRALITHFLFLVRREETPSEKFWKLVKLVDFTTDDEPVLPESGPGKTQPEWTWQNFQANIANASREIESVLALVDWLREGKNIGTTRVVKPDASLRSQNFDFVSAVAMRKSELSRSQQLLDSAALRLTGAVASARVYHAQILELRKLWRVVVPEKQLVGNYRTEYFADISYVHDGFRAKIPFIPLRKSSDGDVMIEHLPSFPLSYITFRCGAAQDDAEPAFPVGRITKAVGVKQCHEYLLAIQQSFWNSIAFKQTSREFQLAADASDVLSSESCIKIPLPKIDEQLCIRFHRRPDLPKTSIPAQGMDVDEPLVQLIPSLAPVDHDYTRDELAWKRLWLSSTLDCSLHRILHSSHVDRLKRYAQLTVSSNKIFSALQRSV